MTENPLHSPSAKEGLDDPGLLRTLIDSLPDHVYVKDTESRYVFNNMGHAKALGAASPEEIAGKSDADFYPKELAERYRADEQEIISSGQPMVNKEEPCVDEEGNESWHSTTKVPLRDGSGKVVGLVGMTRDITERKRSEEALKESEERFRFLVQHTSDIISVIEADGTIRYQSPAIERVLGYRPEELVEQNAFDYVHPDDIERVLDAFVEVLDTRGVNRPVEFRLRRADGSWRYLEVVGNNLLDDPSVRGIIANACDITERKRAEEALRQSEERFRSAFEDAPIGVTLVGLDRRYLRVNRAFCKMLGYSEEELLEKTTPEITHPDDLEASGERAHQMLEEGPGSHTMEKRYIHADGRVVWALSSVSLIRDSQGDPSHFVSLFQDLAERKETEEVLRWSEERFRSLTQNASNITTLLEVDGTILYESPSIERILGYRPEELLGKNVFDYVHPDDLERVLSASAEGLANPELHPSMEYRFRHADGSWRWLESIGSNLLDHPDVGELVVNSRDVTERKALEERLQHQAFHDPLTGLANRALFMDRLEQALARLSRRREPIAVLFIDLDNFKVINDSLGHEVGDRLLVAVAERLKECVRPEDTVARFGGDEFVMLLEGIADLGDATRVSERITEALTAPFEVGGREVFVGTSIGIAPATEAPDEPEDLLRNADLALYGAKKKGKARHEFFDASMGNEALERLELESDLRRALEREEFRVYYQPKISIATDKIVSLEALIRWEHPERGLLEPDQFLPVAEETGLIVQIEEWVLDEVCRQGREWQERFADRTPDRTPPRVCTNISARQFLQTDLVGRVTESLQRSGLRAQGLSLEIPEGVLMEDPEANTEKLTALKDLDIHIVIDDFGTSYSSLSYLKRFPLNFLKIDRSLTVKLGEEPEDNAIVSAMINLAQSLGWAVTAQGVETEEQLTLLREMGCDIVQGYYFTKPVTSEEATELLEADLSMSASS